MTGRILTRKKSELNDFSKLIIKINEEKYFNLLFYVTKLFHENRNNDAVTHTA